MISKKNKDLLSLTTVDVQSLQIYMKPVNNLSNIFYKKQFKATYNGFFHHGLIYRLYEHLNELYVHCLINQQLLFFQWYF